MYRVEEFSGQAEVVVQSEEGDSLETHHDDLLREQRKYKTIDKEEGQES